ncbi:hypothetical protein KIL84_007450 [Mauremys mutica]|uniref:Uncharacterized protein n=1 Tax=Mauremys mutica TaxID=74926 RepID=A0A9D3X1C1_9SAUR|nr:hypothetical protein KIL84_007450 [Mauremys mutica]
MTHCSKWEWSVSTNGAGCPIAQGRGLVHSQAPSTSTNPSTDMQRTVLPQAHGAAAQSAHWPPTTGVSFPQLQCLQMQELQSLGDSPAASIATHAGCQCYRHCQHLQD